MPRTKTQLIVLACAASLVLLACGSRPAPADHESTAARVATDREREQAAPPVPWREICDAAAERASRCEEDWRSGSHATCVGQEPCMGAVLRPDARGALLQCLRDAPCAPGADIMQLCSTGARDALRLPAKNRALYDDCRANLSRCGRAERCGPLPLLVDAARDELTGCFDLACESADSCVEHTFDDLGCP
jgi:hypothetical protein